MPKKTKREKLLAQSHRVEIHAPVVAVTHDEYPLVKRDLIKTVVITSFILVFELLLTYVVFAEGR